MSRCFLLTKELRGSYEEIEKHGEIVQFFKACRDRPQVFDGEAMSKMISELLDSHKFNPDLDYLILAGSLNMLASVVAVAVDRFGVIKTLMFEFSSSKYHTVEIGG
jgi:hypothetical protein